jgi:hypothetical protein|nr:MAG TPA: hypothetical protein [Caudoviricetes sp.]
MFCLFSFIFLFVIISQLENDVISIQQFLFYSIYGTAMFYYTSKKYWNNNAKRYKNKRTNAPKR